MEKVTRLTELTGSIIPLIYRLLGTHEPARRTSRIADMPLCTAAMALGSNVLTSSALCATAAHACPPAAAFAIPEKSGVGEKEMFNSSFEILEP